jgi:hypothetical protein
LGIETLFSTRIGVFVYKNERFHTNGVNYDRWSQAWAFYALTSFLEFSGVTYAMPD